MSVTVSDFGTSREGKQIKLYTIENNGMKACVTNMGAILVSLYVPNKKGIVKDIVLGYEDGADYYNNDCFFGSTIGRSANRIGGAKFEIDGTTYQLAVNDGENNLHSDFENGFHKQIWDAECTDNAVKFSYVSKDGENGFPGNANVSVTYTLTSLHELKLHYEAVSDKKTLFNMTNHSYFNLYGHDHGSISDIELQINAANFTKIVPGAIPTGELTPVKGTPMDFTSFKEIGKEINADWEQMNMVGGYDHNYALDNYDGTLKKVAIAKADGRTMSVYTDLPGIQFYAGNFITPTPGKDGATYDYRGAFCLETQYFPNSANEKSFVQPIFDANEKYDTVTIYQFDWE